MKQKFLTAWILLLMSLAAGAQNYTTLNLSKETVIPGQFADVDFSVRNFKNVFAMQFSVNWDPSVIEFDTVINLNLTNLDISSFGFMPNDINQGRLRFLWDNAQKNPDGEVVPDSTVIFTVRFKGIKQPPAKTSILVTNNPIDIELTKVVPGQPTNFYSDTLVIEPGEVSIENANSVESLTAGEILGIWNEPNPFHSASLLRIQSQASKRVNLHITDVSGREIHRDSLDLRAGKNEFKLLSDWFPVSGNYFVHLTDQRWHVSHQVVHLK